MDIIILLLALSFLSIFIAPVAASPVIRIAPIPPTFVSATTNTVGTVITVTFSEPMARPAWNDVHEFTYSINGGHPQPFRAIARDSGSNTMMDLTIGGKPIEYGETVTLSYRAGHTVKAQNGGILASFSTEPVTNSVPNSDASISYMVTYDGNGNTSGTVPIDPKTYASGAIVTVLDNTGGLVRYGYTFSGWNTAFDGSGTSYSPGATFTMGSEDVTLFAQWNVNVYSS